MQDKSATFLTSNCNCKEGVVDLNYYIRLFEKSGWTVNTDWRESRLIFLYTCAVHELREEESIEIIEKMLLDKGIHQELIVIGCLPDINLGRLRSVFKGRYFSQKDKQEILKICGQENNIDINYNVIDKRFDNFHEIINPIKSYIYAPFLIGLARLKSIAYLYNRSSLFRKFLMKHHFPLALFLSMRDPFFIRISEGCNNACSFCAIKKARGSIKSKPVEQIQLEFRRGIQCGYKWFYLVATDAGSYGKDLGANFCDLLKILISEKGEYRIFIGYIEPNNLFNNSFFEEFKSVCCSGKISGFCCPLQSGSNKILRLMNRHYQAEEYQEKLIAFKNIFPKIYLSTFIMPGFPGENDQDFEETIKLIKRIPFDQINIMGYSDRLGTPSKEMNNKVNMNTVFKRVKRIESLRWRIKFNWAVNKLRHSILKHSPK